MNEQQLNFTVVRHAGLQVKNEKFDLYPQSCIINIMRQAANHNKPYTLQYME